MNGRGPGSNGNGKEVAVKEAAEDFPRLLEQSKGEIAKLLPEGVAIERVMRMALNLYRMNPDIRGCSSRSILATVMRAAELNLELGGGLKQAWPIPYKGECTFQLGYQGVLELARRSGHFRVIEVRTVLDSDEFSIEYTPRPVIRHVPDLHERGAEIGAYAYAVLNSGEMAAEWMSRATIEKIRKTAKQQHVWNQWWGEMAKRSVLKRFLKRQPASVMLRSALAADDDLDAIGAADNTQAVTSAERALSSASARLGKRLAIEAAPAVATAPAPAEAEESWEGETAEETQGREPGEEG